MPFMPDGHRLDYIVFKGSFIFKIDDFPLAILLMFMSMWTFQRETHR